MTNKSLFEHLFGIYSRLSAADSYIIGFRFRGNVYMITVDEESVKSLTKLDKASRGAGYSLRFKPTTDEKIYLLRQGAQVLCSEEFFDDMVKTTVYNKGEIFEKLVTESFGQVWVKDNIPFYVDGDITVDGVKYQIKFEKATYSNEKSLYKLNAER